MNKEIRKYLESHKRKIISLNELENLFSGSVSYREFAKKLMVFIEEDILTPVISHGGNNKSIPLYYSYRINTSKLNSSMIDDIQKFQLSCHSSIKLNKYYRLSGSIWNKDKKIIIKIDNYLKENGLPQNTSTIPEMSYNLIGDEKWIDNRGKVLLERIDLWEKLMLDTNPDPLMISINPDRINSESHKHLVVENKTTFYYLMDSLKYTNFTSLIYGCGWKIVANINNLERQIGLENKLHKVYYFGDLDYEGLSIWKGLKDRRDIYLAKEFYESFLNKDFTKGKLNQTKNIAALTVFLKNFDKENQERIVDVLEKGGYYPQEALNKNELKSLWIKLDEKIN